MAIASHVFIDDLSGPDTGPVLSGGYPTGTPVGPSLGSGGSGEGASTSVVLVREPSLSGSGGISVSTGTGSGGFEGFSTGVTVDVGTALSGGVDVLWGGRTTADPYYFNGSMSEEVLHAYLDRAMQLSLLSHMWYSPQYEGPEYPSYPANVSKPADAYDPTFNVDPLHDPGYPHGQYLQMILNAGAKLVWDMASFYGTNIWDYLTWICQTLTNDTTYLHNIDPDIICGASIPEVIIGDMNISLPYSKIVNGVSIVDMFYPPSNPRPATAPNPSGGGYFTVNPSTFDYRLMMIDYVQNDADENPGWNFFSHLDLTKTEAQMWYYYLATRYIDCHCEFILFGDLFYGCLKDEGNRTLWNLVSLIRDYARQFARRGVVLLSTHVNVVPNATVVPTVAYGSQSISDHSMYTWYYDPPGATLPDWQRQLIFDAASLGVYYKRTDVTNCYGTNNLSGYGSAYMPVYTAYGYGLLNHSLCGLHPLGWYCSHQPVMLHFDIGGNQQPKERTLVIGHIGHPPIDITETFIYAQGAGCSYAAPTDPSDPSQPDCWGYDNGSWFAWQQQPIQELILIYTYYIIKCLDPYAHFAMSLRIITHNAPTPGQFEGLALSSTVQGIWNGTDAGPFAWILHNFNFENVADSDVLPASSLIFVNNSGFSAIYFIADDGYIHGYIKVNSNYNDGTWLTVSPSYAADVPAGSQVRALSNLVASPDGTKLLYIGTNNLIYGFSIVDAWTYQYIQFNYPTAVIVLDSLVFADDNNIFFLSNENPSGNVYVFGFQVLYWGSFSVVAPNNPTISAYYSGQVESIQTGYWGNGVLKYESNTKRLYYRTNIGNLAYFQVNSTPTNTFSSFTLVSLLPATVQGDIAIYYDASTGNTTIYFIDPYSLLVAGLTERSGVWAEILPSFNATSYGAPIGSQVTSLIAGDITVSPDGTTIVYAGVNASNETIMAYLKFYGTYYKYFEISSPPDYGDINSIQFTDNDDIYCINVSYISAGGIIFHFKYQEDYCNNGIFQRYPLY